MQVVQPAAIGAAIVAREEETLKQDEVLAALQRDLRAARYAAQRAQKRYDAADAENRLVADELERRWNDALLRVEELESRIEQQSHTSGQIPPTQPEEFTDLAAAFESIWPQADARLKKRIVRTLIHQVVVHVDNATSEIVLVIHWKGGVHTEIRVPRRRRGENTTHTRDAIDAVRQLVRICPPSGIRFSRARSPLSVRACSGMGFTMPVRWVFIDTGIFSNLDLFLFLT
ncbi:hypothetical protein BJG93_33685 (plasmid) [Paraburkholderia sprentiae WSM5005]|uniref:Uncharacterized protein n=1 Tax=Paraburkholderia sprentiae WSM5005 TaxID=754502 RepID=A0A1I9YWD7_9BURK|nr:hypothetical protein [Paraburkholderia sprentiae]APA90514.1 hypothetical protein BJG93_33685 [Paraburkholderia sprentiae WSM5005]